MEARIIAIFSVKVFIPWHLPLCLSGVSPRQSKGLLHPPHIRLGIEMNVRCGNEEDTFLGGVNSSSLVRWVVLFFPTRRNSWMNILYTRPKESVLLSRADMLLTECSPSCYETIYIMIPVVVIFQVPPGQKMVAPLFIIRRNMDPGEMLLLRLKGA
jgi:hypothetical protein